MVKLSKKIYRLHREKLIAQFGDALFISQRSKKLQVRSVQNAVSRLAELAGLKEVSPHTFRHTFAKSRLDSDMSLDEVATLLEYEILDTTSLFVTPGERDLESAGGVLMDA